MLSFRCKKLTSKNVADTTFKFPTTSHNREFHIHRSHIETGLSEEIKFCIKKLFKRTHFMSPCKMINLFQDVLRARFKDPLQVL